MHSPGATVTTSFAAPVAVRLGVVAAVAVSMAGGLYAALLLLGVPVPAPHPQLEAVHGPVMVLGVVGTLVALERAVALGARWALVSPGFATAGGLVLLAGGPTMQGKLLLSAASAALLVVYAALWRRQASVALLVQAAGAFAWYAGVLLWLGGFQVAETVPWLAGFVVLTIAGERLELARVGIGQAAERWFVAVAAVVLAGLAAATLWPGPGHRLWGLSLLAVAAWLVAYDVARRTVRSLGLARYAAVGLLAGYGWLGVAALLWAGAFHVVSAQFDTAYREGAFALRPDDSGGAQVLDLAPAAGGFVETVFPEPGTYPFLSHSMVDADRGARGAFQVIP